MIEWADTDRMVRDAIREFVDRELRPHIEELEHGDLPPYDLIRTFFKSFGLDALARESFDPDGTGGDRGGDRAALSLITVSELSRVGTGLVTAMGVSVGLAGGTIMSRGTPEQRTRWARDLLTFDKVGAWAITEPDSGSDAFGGMKTVARRDGDRYVLNGQKTFITNGPYADTLVVYAKLDDEVATFVLDSGMPGLTQSKPLRKMGIHSSPTGQLFFDDVVLEPDRLLAGSGRDSARANFAGERYGVAAMALGIIEECLRLSTDYARSRVAWGRPIGDYQLIQLKLATMEVARLNVQNLVFRTVELLRAGRTPTLAEASAMKLYSSQAATEVAMEAVQLFGGNGYMSEYRVEQLARDAKALMIYAGSNEVQVTHIAKDLLRR
ncbi:acyl-CoA dehydrogenase family protein [Actinophytocola sp.]|uniref:acyl-CoA dehydrogenase family protein n=1 Tax=Actinophytocola sp. TaxID=1872138 RepID=UPI002D7E742B|nr:acyl-CoA dehydrogenase family protein [Actinophytocola sp.]HET9139845.1 acyl-CoA dehydrogenase family protein [Actinophytocola sp.]